MSNENKKKEPEIIVTNNIGDKDISIILAEILSNYIAEKIKKADVPPEHQSKEAVLCR